MTIWTLVGWAGAALSALATLEYVTRGREAPAAKAAPKASAPVQERKNPRCKKPSTSRT